MVEVTSCVAMAIAIRKIETTTDAEHFSFLLSALRDFDSVWVLGKTFE